MQKKYLSRGRQKIIKTFLIFGSDFVHTAKGCDINDISCTRLQLLLFRRDGLLNPVNCDKFNGTATSGNSPKKESEIWCDL